MTGILHPPRISASTEMLPGLMTWRLWRIFYDSLPRHPLFWRDLSEKVAAQRPENWRQTLRQILISAMIPLMLLLLFWLILPFLAILYLMLFAGALVAGANAAAGVSLAISREQETQRFDQFALAPSGAFGVSQVLATRFLRRSHRTVRLNRLIKGFHVICLAMVVAIVMISYFVFGARGGYGFTEAVFQLLVGLLFVGMLRLDFMQAVLLGTLLGIVTPVYTARRFDAALFAPAVFVVLKLVTYLVITGSTGLIASLLESLGVGDPLLLLVLSGIILMFLIHEAVLYWIWRLIESQLNLEANMLPTMNRYGL